MHFEQIYTRLEISLWSAFISLMSESTILRSLFQIIFQITRKIRRISFWIQALLWSAAGLLLGVALGWLSV